MNFVSKRDEVLVTGFVKSSGSLQHSDNSYHNIPSLVFYIIMHFFSEMEKFDDYPEAIEISIDGGMFTSNTAGWLSVYGSNIFHAEWKSIYKWTFKGISGVNGGILIGIHSHDNKGKLLRFSS